MTEQEKLINVDLYGDGSRNSRLRAEYIYCDHADVCSVYKEGKCFRKTTLFGVRCEFGRITYVDGGTKKTKMYGRVYSEAKDSERYHKLSYPNNTYIAKIGDGAFLARPMSESNAARIPGYSVIILGSVAIVSLSLLTS